MKTRILIALLFLLGVSILLYPNVSDYVNGLSQAQVVENYSNEVEKMKAEEMSREIQRARDYNENLARTLVIDPFTETLNEALSADYQNILNVKGQMGTILIPCIEVKLPIYHGTGPEVLQKGVGHLQNTAFPVGGVGTHAVLSGHRGLPEAKLFTDLDKVAIGDKFYIEVLNETLAYEVDQIKTVLPDQTEDLQAVSGKDYVTLVTCTPYAINSHRLLVRGRRTEFTPEVEEELKQQEKKMKKTNYRQIIFFAVVVVCILLFFYLLFFGFRRGSRGGGAEDET